VGLGEGGGMRGVVFVVYFGFGLCVVFFSSFVRSVCLVDRRRSQFV
jgi:hypothetical protein